MARRFKERDTSLILAAADRWINSCLIQDGSVFTPGTSLWTLPLIDEVYHAFVEHPDFGGDNFITKLKNQIADCSAPAKHLVAEMLWALLLFPSNVNSDTKRPQITELWGLAGDSLAQDHPLLHKDVLVGIGSGGPAFNNYRPYELEFLIALTRNLKNLSKEERSVFRNYDSFLHWIGTVPMEGNRQFRHMLRYFSFPDSVERISSNNDRISILKEYGTASAREMVPWTDRQLDEALLALRTRLQDESPTSVLDFYESPWVDRWAKNRTIKTSEGVVTVTVPGADDEEIEEPEAILAASTPGQARQSFQIQAKLVHIGAVMGFRVWLPRSDKGRVGELLSAADCSVLLAELPLNYDETTVDTIEQIDVIWLRGRSIARAFEIEHTTAIYSGLLRMADLLALQPNMNIRLHIVAPEERREKVFHEMQRPVFSLLDHGPLAKSCSFVSYESVNLISATPHLAHMNDSIIAEYEELPEST